MRCPGKVSSGEIASIRQTEWTDVGARCGGSHK